MKILINTSTLYFGGGVQVALSFIREIREEYEHEYYVFLSQEINRQLDKSLFPNNFHFYLIDKSPSKLFTRKKVVKRLDNLENDINPDVVFTVFGPSYWKPKSVHLTGFADGWVYNPSSIAFDRLPFLKRIKMRLAVKYKIFYLKRDANYYVLETNDAANKLSLIMKEKRDKFYVVGNTVSSIFSDEEYLKKENQYYIKLPKKVEGEFRLLYIAHNHPSKNLNLLNEVLKHLKSYNIKIILTIDEKSYQEIFDEDLKSKVINVGLIPQFSCPSLYEQTDAVISTSLLETFSAVFPEAMKMKKPILSSDFSFARDICGDSVLYFDALISVDTANKIITLMSNKELQNELIQKGEKKLMTFETSKSRAKKYLNILNEIKEKNV